MMMSIILGILKVNIDKTIFSTPIPASGQTTIANGTTMHFIIYANNLRPLLIISHSSKLYYFTINIYPKDTSHHQRQ